MMEMFEEAIKMFDDTQWLQLLINEDTSLARNVFARDEFLDDINKRMQIV